VSCTRWSRLHASIEDNECQASQSQPSKNYYRDYDRLTTSFGSSKDIREGQCPSRGPHSRIPMRGSRRFWTQPITSLPPSGHAMVRNSYTSPEPREPRLRPTLRMEATPRHTQTKPSTCYNNPRETTQKQPDTTNPSPMILDHLAFSPKLVARPNQQWQDLRKHFSDDSLL